MTQFLLLNTTLRRLDISGNPIEDKGVEHLAQSLRLNDALGELNIKETYVGDPGAQCLFECFYHDFTIQISSMICNLFKTHSFCAIT
jgi:Ran GTPase-activating protein (RanGAP) involved in mRNA processing and transport